MLTADRSGNLSRRLIDLVDKALKEKGLSARGVSIEVVGHDGLIRDIRAGRIPSYDRVRALLEYLGIDLYLDEAPSSSGPLAIDPERTLPHHGMAHCGTNGWADDQIRREDLPRPAWVNDDTAFWVSAQGTSMQPDGIRSGDFCIVSPARLAQVGDRVWVREATQDRRVAIKRLIQLDRDSATLRGWLPPENGTQSDFIETRPLRAIAEMHPVIGVYRGRLGKSGVDVKFMPDPRDGRLTGADEMHIIPLSKGDADLPARHQFPLALGFPRAYLRRRTQKPDQLILLPVSDGAMSPYLQDFAVVLVDASQKRAPANEMFALRLEGRTVVRWMQEVESGALLLSTADPSIRRQVISRGDTDAVEILGRVLWSGGSL